MPELQETLKEATTPMVELDTTGNSVDIELDDSKANTKEVETKELPQSIFSSKIKLSLLQAMM